MTIYALTYQDYKEYFNELTEYNENDEDFIDVEVKAIENKEDIEYEFSIEWNTINLPKNENGKIYGINTSSAWALMSCGWYEYEDETDEDM